MATSTTRNTDPPDPMGSNSAAASVSVGGGTPPPPPRTGASAAGALFDPKPILTVPVVIDRRDGKKRRKGRRKKKFTGGTKAMQRFLFGSTRGAYRAANALGSGMRLFVRRSNRSRRKKKDGFVRDSLRNFSRGFGRAASEFGRGPFEIGRRVSTRRVWRTFRLFVPARR